MADEENVEETADEANAQPEGAVTDAELLAALGLNDQLQPLSETPGKAGEGQSKRTPAKAAAAMRPASGENTGEEDETDREDEDDEGEENAQDDDPEEDEGDEESEPESEEQEDEQEEEEERRQQPKSIRSMQKRIDKLTARTKELDTALSKAQRVTLAPSERDPLSDINTEAELADYLGHMKRMRRWCHENRDGGELLDDKGNPRELSAKQVGARLAHAEEILQEYGPARRAYLQERAKYDELARRDYPNLFDNKSMESRLMANFLSLCPEMLRVPNYQMIIGDAIRGMRDRMVASSKNGAKTKMAGKKQLADAGGGLSANSKVKLAPKAIRGAAAPQTRTKSSGAFSRLEREFLSSGDKNKLTALIASTL